MEVSDWFGHTLEFGQAEVWINLIENLFVASSSTQKNTETDFEIWIFALKKGGQARVCRTSPARQERERRRSVCVRQGERIAEARKCTNNATDAERLSFCSVHSARFWCCLIIDFFQNAACSAKRSHLLSFNKSSWYHQEALSPILQVQCWWNTCL